MKTKSVFSDIVISGAGIAGTTLAILLAQAGFKTVLIDAEQPPSSAEEKPSGRTAALLEGSINVIKATGVWDELVQYATPLKIMKIVDDSKGKDGQIETAFHATSLGKPCFGYNVPNGILRNALLKCLPAVKNLVHLNPDRLKAYTVDQGRVRIETEQENIVTANVLIGCDGRASAVRAIAGIETAKDDYHQTAITCLIEHTKPHNFTSTEFHRSGGPFTFVPMTGNTSSVVWVEKKEDAQKFLSMKKQDFEKAIQDRSHGILGTISLKSAPESWPLMYLSADKLTAERVALAAETAHVLSPIGAQGLNLSLRDIASLAETITDAALLGEDIGSQTVLDRYEARRRLDMRSHVLGIDGLNRAVANDRAAIRDIRRLGLKGIGGIPPLKHFVMKQGLSPSMDKARLLSGLPL
jgi:2-octaprenyl-6-methoxyphenol hydroxylase